MKSWMWRRSNEVEEQARVRGRDKCEGKKEREKRRRDTSRRPMARDLRNVSFFSSLFIPALPFPSFPTFSPIILLPLFLRSSSSSSTRWLHACTYACAPSSSFSTVRLFLPAASSLVLLAFSPRSPSPSPPSYVRTCTCPFFCQISVRFFGPRSPRWYETRT